MSYESTPLKGVKLINDKHISSDDYDDLEVVQVQPDGFDALVAEKEKAAEAEVDGNPFTEEDDLEYGPGPTLPPQAEADPFELITPVLDVAGAEDPFPADIPKKEKAAEAEVDGNPFTEEDDLEYGPGPTLPPQAEADPFELITPVLDVAGAEDPFPADIPKKEKAAEAEVDGNPFTEEDDLEYGPGPTLPPQAEADPFELITPVLDVAGAEDPFPADIPKKEKAAEDEFDALLAEKEKAAEAAAAPSELKNKQTNEFKPIDNEDDELGMSALAGDVAKVSPKSQLQYSKLAPPPEPEKPKQRRKVVPDASNQSKPVEKKQESIADVAKVSPKSQLQGNKPSSSPEPEKPKQSGKVVPNTSTHAKIAAQLASPKTAINASPAAKETAQFEGCVSNLISNVKILLTEYSGKITPAIKANSESYKTEIGKIVAKLQGYLNLTLKQEVDGGILDPSRKEEALKKINAVLDKEASKLIQKNLTQTQTQTSTPTPVKPNISKPTWASSGHSNSEKQYILKAVMDKDDLHPDEKHAAIMHILGDKFTDKKYKELAYSTNPEVKQQITESYLALATEAQRNFRSP